LALVSVLRDGLLITQLQLGRAKPEADRQFKCSFERTVKRIETRVYLALLSTKVVLLFTE
jgi:hypothetical protein